MNANGRLTISAVIMSCPSTSVRSPISGLLPAIAALIPAGMSFAKCSLSDADAFWRSPTSPLSKTVAIMTLPSAESAPPPEAPAEQDIHDDQLSPHHAGFPRERIGAFGTDRPQRQSQGHTVVPDVQTAHSLLADATDAPSTHCLFEAHRSLMDPSVTWGRPCGWAIIHVEAIPTEYGPC